MLASRQIAGAAGSLRLAPVSARTTHARQQRRVAGPLSIVVRSKPQGSSVSQESQPGATLDKVALGAVPLLLRAGEAAAEGAAEAAPPSTSVGEVLLLLAPILLYGTFSVYREKVNPRAKLSDFLFIAAGAVIVLNILSILIFKVRVY